MRTPMTVMSCKKSSLNTLEAYGDVNPYGNQRQALSKELTAYLAGLMDGDGNISLARQRYNKKDKSPHYRIVAVINMTHKETIEWINSIIPGSLYCVQHKSNHKESWNRKPIHRWAIWGLQAEWFIRQIIPYMRVRKKQAEVALAFQDAIENGRDKRNNGRFVSLTQEELNKRETFYWQMRTLNSRQIAAAETKREDPTGISDSPRLCESLG